MSYMKKILFFILLFLLPIFCFSEEMPHLVISEIQVSGKSSTDEYIKIYNPQNEDVNLKGYKIVKKTTSGSQYNLVSNFEDTSIIKGKSYFIIAHKDYTGVADFYYTNNSYSLSKDNSVYIIDSNSNIIDLVGFGNCYEKEGDKCLDNIDSNKIYIRNNNIDTDNNVNDFSISSLDNNVSNDNTVNEIDENTTIENVEDIKIIYPKTLIFSEIYPNPQDGEDEFIEIKNTGNVAIDINGYKIKDSSKRVFTIKNVILNSNDFYVFYRKDTGIALNNTGEEHLYFYTPNNELVYKLEYIDAKKGNSYAYNGNEYIWSIKKTPGVENIIEIENIAPTIVCNIPTKASINIAFNVDCSDSYDENGDNLRFNIDMGDGRSSEQDNFYFRYFNAGDYIIHVNIYDSRGLESIKNYKINVSSKIDDIWFLPEDIEKQEDEICNNISSGELQDYNIGDCVKLTSFITSMPNSLIDKIFYVDGAQVYFYSEDFPDMNLGDEITLTGEVSSNRGEKRIKIDKKEDIIINKNKQIKEEYYKAYSNEDLELNIAKLVLVEGIIISKTKNHIIIQDNDQKFDIYLSNKLVGNIDNIARGDKVSAIGIVNKINDNFRIILRKFNDIQKIEEKNDTEDDFNIALVQEDSVVNDKQSYGYVAESQSQEQEYIVNTNNNTKRILLMISSAILVIIVIIVLFLIIKNDKKKKSIAH